MEAFGRILDIMDELREKCPWDREQTMESLRHLTIEETYELSDAILEDDLEEVKKELMEVKKNASVVTRHGDKVETIFSEMQKRFSGFEKFSDIVSSINL